MANDRLSRYVLASLLTHGALGVGLLVYARLRPPPPPEQVVMVTTDFDYAALPPPPPAPPSTPEPPPPPAPVAPPTADNAPRPAMRLVDSNPTVRNTQAQEPNPNSGNPEPGPVNPNPQPQQSNTAQANSGNARIITAASLMDTSNPNHDTDMMAVARNSGINLGTPGASVRQNRSIFGGPRGGGDPAEQARNAVGDTLRNSLAQNDHMNAAGSSENGRRVSRRAEETFDPFTAVPNIGDLILRAPVVRVTPPPRTVTPGELAAADGVDMHNGNMPLMASIGRSPLPAASYHALRIELEMVQDSAGHITSSRVLTSSRTSALDTAAQRAMREAMDMVPTPSSPNGRRTVWLLELSNAASFGDRILGGGDEGWRVLPGERDGVRVRMRIRLTRAVNLPSPGAPQGAGPRPTG